MRIDPKYFNQFMVVVAVFCIAAIALASYRYVDRQEQRFMDRMEQTPASELHFLTMDGDTLQLDPERTTVILFWATWSGRSLESLYELYQWHDSYPQFEVIAAFVKDAPEFALAHNRESKERFMLVNGTPAYQDLRVPGVPSAIILDSQGRVVATEVGSSSVPIWQKLSTRDQLHSSETAL
ncbi:hypothetical protein QA596_01540 [Balneolales bacterium ANBcel1]|nr:hypothetical protein [Balneolales bacterium ANBcel1]